MRSTNSKTGEPLLPLPCRPGWRPAPRLLTKTILQSSANPSPPIRSHRRRNYSSRVQVSKNGYEPQYWATLGEGQCKRLRIANCWRSCFMKRANRLGLAYKYPLGASCHVCYLSQLQRVKAWRDRPCRGERSAGQRANYRSVYACGASRKLSPPIVTHTSSRGTS